MLWLYIGKPKHDPVCELMQKTRLQREDMARIDTMAKSMHAKDTVSVCKDVSKSYKNVLPKAPNVNGANNPTAVSAMWKIHFEFFLNSAPQMQICKM